MTRFELQHCNSFGSELGDECKFPSFIELDDALFRHRCLDEMTGESNIFYYKTHEDSRVWGVYNDETGVHDAKLAIKNGAFMFLTSI